MGKKSSAPAPAPDPSVGYAQMQQQQIATEQWDDYRNIERPYLRELGDRQQANADAYQSMAEIQQNKLLGWGQEAHDYGLQQRTWGQGQQEKYSQQSDDERARYMSEYRPFEDKLIKDANEYNTDANFEKQAGYASGDIASAFQQQRQAAQIQRQSYGINPNSGAAMAGEGGLDAGEAAMRAAAMTRARDGAKELGWQKNANMANAGQGLLANQQAYSGMGQQMGGYALGASEAGLNSVNSGLAAGMGGLNAGQMGISNAMGRQQLSNQTGGAVGQLYQNVGQLGNARYGQQMGAWQAQEGVKGQQAAGTGQAIGAIAGVAAIAI